MSAGILQNSMVAQCLPRKLHIMPPCPIIKLFNYTFIAFVVASLAEKIISPAVGNRALADGE